MGQRREISLKKRPPLPERILLRLCDSAEIDGLRIVSWKSKDTEFRCVEEALDLIKTHDRVRYNRLIRDLQRIWVVPLSGAVGAFDPATVSCKLDPRFVLAEPAEMVAAVIVHEAAHARLVRCRIGYEEDERSRVEAVCVRRELAFAARLPDGEQVREKAVQDLERCANRSLWSNASLIDRRLSAEVRTLRYVGCPDWLARMVIAIRDVKLRISRFVRGLVIWRRF
jgi:hypothetical protein